MPILFFLVILYFSLPAEGSEDIKVVKENPGRTFNANDPFHHELQNKLLEKYNKNVMPVQAKNQTLELAFGLAMIHIHELSSKGVLSATAWLRMVWNDYRLQWHEDDWGGVSDLRVDPADIWLPDIEVYNAKDVSLYSLASQFNFGANALIYPDGEIIFIPPVNLEVFCSNYSYALGPMEEQECHIKFGSWTHHGDLIRLSLFNNKPEIDLSDLAESSPWKVTKQFGNPYNVKKYNCCEEPYVDLNYRFMVKPQFTPRPDGSSVSLTHLLHVTSTILVILILLLTLALAVVVMARQRNRLDTFSLIRHQTTPETEFS